MKKMKRVLGLVLCLCMALALTACGSGSGKSGSAEDSEKTVVVAVGADVISMNPQAAFSNDNNLFITQVYDTLVTLGNDLEIKPSLATSWEWTDDTTLVMKLRDDVVFHNGEKMTADDVVYTLQMATQANAIAVLASMIDAENTFAVDEYTVSIGLLEPFPALLTQLAHPDMSILCKSVVEKDYENYGTGEIVGTGPFKFVKTVAGDASYFDTNKDYWGEKAGFDHLTMRTITESSSRSIALENGEVDMAVRLAAEECTRLQDVENVTMSVHTTGAIVYVQFNCVDGPFSDPALREAMMYAVDTQALVDVCYDGWATRAVGMLTPNVVGYDPTIVDDDYKYDPEKAKQILADAGYEDGVSARFLTTDSRKTIAEAIQGMAEEVGIHLEIYVEDSATWLSDLNSLNHEIAMVGKNSGATGDAYYGLFTAFHSSAIGSSNQGGYNNPEVDKLLEDAAAEMDDETRADLYSQVQHKLMEPDQLPWLPISFDFEADGYGPTVASYEFSVNTFTRFNTIVLA